MCCCQLHEVACIIQLLSQTHANATDKACKSILLYSKALIFAKSIQIITSCSVILARNTAQGQLYTRIHIEALVHLKALAIFCTQRCSPGLIIASQLMTIKVTYIIFVLQTTAFSNQIQILSVFTGPGAI